jgi:uncharacterized phage-associated protein
MILQNVISAAEAASYIVSKHDNVTPLKLQKLLYYLAVWGIVSEDYAVDAKFEKWQYGPVHPKTYQQFKQYGSVPIPSTGTVSLQVSEQAGKTIDFVLECYSAFNASTLSSLTHQELPWKQTHANKEISEHSIYQFYSKISFAKNFPFDPSKPFYPVSTDLHHAFILDMNKKDASAVSIYPSYLEFRKQVQQAQATLTKFRDRA